MKLDDTFCCVVGLLSLAGWTASYSWQTPVSELAGWFGAVAGGALLAMQIYQQLR